MICFSSRCEPRAASVPAPRMSPASSSGTSSREENYGCIKEDGIGRERGGKRADSTSHNLPHLPLASTSSAADDAATASALSAALLPLFPPVSAAWAYGSGVFSQRQQRIWGSESEYPRPSVDLLLAVPDPRQWHEANLRSNPGHYSSPARGLLGAAGISWLAESVGPGAWFNSGVRATVAAVVGEEGEEEEGKGKGKRRENLTVRLKYGVFSEEALLSDLESWGELYLAGRLQKPTLRLSTAASYSPGATTPSSPSSFASQLEAALEANAASALAAALLLLPPTFAHSCLLSTLVSLSYSGDVRVAAAAEDPMKVENIVRGTGRRRLDGLYSRHLCLSSSPSSTSSSSSPPSSSVASAAGLVPLCDGSAWAQDPRRDARRSLMELLPEKVRRKVVEAAPCPSSSWRSSATASSSSRPPSSPFHFASPAPLSSSSSLVASSVRSALTSTVRSSSARAALVGLVSAGPAGAVSRKEFFVSSQVFSSEEEKRRRREKAHSFFPLRSFDYFQSRTKQASYALAKLRKGGWGGGGTR